MNEEVNFPVITHGQLLIFEFRDFEIYLKIAFLKLHIAKSPNLKSAIFFLL